MKAKALVLLSGGLDSMLAVRTLLEQDVEVVGITFISNFFGAKRGLEAAAKLGVPLIAYNIAEKHLEMVKKPKYGYGKNMNPCIDCHSMMLMEAKEIMEGKEVVLVYPDGSIKAVSQKYDFIATGEVLGQRPMSQTKAALAIVAKYSGVGDLLVRPLSAKLLDLTAPEKEGKINREGLLDISGRSRSRQTELAKQYGIKDYPSPAGGCLLTVPEFGARLKELFENWPDCNGNDVELLKHGRLFWLNHQGKKVLAVIGRDEKDNQFLEKLKQPNDLLLNLIEEIGPTALIRSKDNSFMEGKGKSFSIDIPNEMNIESLKSKESLNKKEILEFASFVTGFYAKAKGKKVNLKIE